MTNARQGSQKTSQSHTHTGKTQQIFNADNSSLLVVVHSAAFVFPSRLDYGNGEGTSDLNSARPWISDVCRCLEKKIHFSTLICERRTASLPQRRTWSYVSSRQRTSWNMRKMLEMCVSEQQQVVGINHIRISIICALSTFSDPYSTRVHRGHPVIKCAIILSWY